MAGTGRQERFVIMSRSVAIGIIAVLIVLLAFVNQAVNPMRAPEKRGMTAQQQENMFKQTQEKRKAEEKKQMANTLAHEKKYEKEHPYKDTMTNDWYRERTDGHRGLKDL